MFSLILPTYNEAENIEKCIQAVAAALDGREFEIIVADDDSPDKTWEVAEKLGHPNVRVLRRTDNKGLSPAVVDGFGVASGDLLGVMDADMQHDEAILPQMIDLLESHEMVIGSRGVEGGSYGKFTAYRKFTSWFAATLARVILGIRLTDPMAGYFVLRRDTFERAKQKLSPKGFKILLEVYCCAHPVDYAEVGFYFRTRLQGESKLTAGVMLEYLKSLIELRKKMRA